MKKKWLAFSIFLLVASVGLQGCFIGGPIDDEPRGAIAVSWTFDGVEACPDNVGNVVVQYRVPGGSPIDAVVQCENGQSRIPELVAGTYFVRLKGIDGEVITWESQELRVEVLAEREAVVNLDLVEIE